MDPENAEKIDEDTPDLDAKGIPQRSRQTVSKTRRMGEKQADARSEPSSSSGPQSRVMLKPYENREVSCETENRFHPKRALSEERREDEVSNRPRKLSADMARKKFATSMPPPSLPSKTTERNACRSRTSGVAPHVNLSEVGGDISTHRLLLVKIEALSL